MTAESRERLFLVTNDDGIEAKGLKELVEVVRPFGRIVVVAPAEPQSGMSHAITVKVPLRIKKLEENSRQVVYKCFGTPVDCVKLAFNQLLPEKPDLLISGINHGSNASTSVFYSGTLGAALEGSINEVPSIGFSLLNLDHEADFTTAKAVIQRILKAVLEHGIPRSVCLNVNIPDMDASEIRGIRFCRQNRGYWREEFDKRTDPRGKSYYWLTGTYHNSEPDAEDTDEWALRNGFVSVVPLQTDLTAYDTLPAFSSWKFDGWQEKS